MSTSQMSDEEALEAAWEAGYEEGAADALVEALDEDHIEDWIDELRKSGINVLEWFQVRWDAAEKRIVVEQKKQEEEVDLDAFYAEEKESHCGDA